MEETSWRDDMKTLYELTASLKKALQTVEDTLQSLEQRLHEIEQVQEDTLIQCTPEAVTFFEEIGCAVDEALPLKDVLIKMNTWLFFTNQVSSDSTIHLRDDVRELLQVPSTITYVELLGAIVRSFTVQN